MEDRALSAVNALKVELDRERLADFVVVNTDGWAADPAAVQFKAKLAAIFKPDIILCLGGEAPFCSELGSASTFRQKRVDSPRVIKERSRENRRSLREFAYVNHFQGARVKVYNTSHTTIAGIDRAQLFGTSQAKDLLVGLYDLKKQFLGLGVVRDIDHTRRAIKVFTKVEVKPALVFFGKVRLDAALHEMPESV
jgi:polynucleotide 5'-kinase involved in rRNA processing